MDSGEYDKQLRFLLDVPDGMKAQGILSLICNEGWEPALINQVVDGMTLWACPARKGIFWTVQRNEATGQQGYAGSPTPEIAALEGLRRARFIAPLKELWESIASKGIAESQVQETVTKLQGAVTSKSTVVGDIDVTERNLWLGEFIEKMKPKTVEHRIRYLQIGAMFLLFLLNKAACQQEPTDAIVKQFFDSTSNTDNLRFSSELVA